MKKPVKIVAILIGVAIIAVLGVLTAAKILITPERVRQKVVPIAEKTLDRPVSIGDIDVHILSGIEINNFVVRSKDGKEAFVSADALVLRYQFWPLLKFRVVLDEARLEAPKIRVVRFENGQFNFSDLLSKDKSKQSSTEKPTVPDVPAEGGPAIDFVVNEMRINGGELLFIDRSLGPKAREFRLTDLNLEASDIEIDQAFPVALDALINGAPLEISGTLNPRTNAGDARIKLREFNVAAIMPYAAGKFPGKLTSMALGFDLTVKGDPKTITSSGSITADNIDMVLNAIPDAPFTDARLGFAYQVSADTNAKTVRIDKADADINGIQASLTGSVSEYAVEPKLNLHAVLPPIDIQKIMDALPGALVQPVSSMKPAGRISAEFDLAGTTANPKALVREGRVLLDGAQVSINNLRATLAGAVQMKSDRLTARGMNIRLNDSTAVLDLEASNLMAKPVRLTHTLTSDMLNIDQLTAAAGDEKKPSPPPPGKKDVGKAPGPPAPTKPINLPLTADGTIRVKRSVYQGVDINNLELLYHLENNILDVRKMRGEVAGGTVGGTLRADLNRTPLTYETKLSIDGTRTEALVSALFPKAENTVFGNLFLNLGLTGAGISFDDITRSLTGQADLRMTDGRLTGAGLVQGLASFLDLKELQVLSFKAIKGDVRLQEGKFKINSDYTSDKVLMTPTGSVGLDGKLDLSLNLRLAPELAAKAGGDKNISRLLGDQQGWALIPLKVGGSLTSPRFALDQSAVKQQLQQKGEQKLKEKLQEELFKRVPRQKETTPDEPGQPPAQTEPGKQPPVDQLLEKLFKK